jgi:prolipoprotein diacylglyceryltransferase
LTIPFEPIIFGININVHLILEYLAFIIAFRYYVVLRRSSNDTISYRNRLSIILGAIIGAFIGSRLMGFLENPFFTINSQNVTLLMDIKSIMGGLFGGLLGVELAKKIIKEKQSSGDLFTFPIIIGIMIGRVGCFLNGIDEFAYGIETNWITGMDLGDGLMRHPTSLYEIFFLLLLFISLKIIQPKIKENEGMIFKFFMIFYFGFRFFIEFIKPNIFYFGGLSSIQWLCIICWIYYIPTLKKMIKYAH